MTSECFNLSWRDFETCTSNVFKELLNDELFADVTLVCEDNKQIKAHKAILSSSSTFFKNIFINNPHPHPLIYLKGIKLAELDSIIRFVYLGETEVGQDDVDKFMEAAQGLEIKGLLAVTNNRELDESSRKELHSSNLLREETISTFFKEKNVSGCELDVKPELDVHFENVLNSSPSLNALNLIKEEDLFFNNPGKTEKSDMFPCEQCDYKASRADHLKRHKFSIHENGRLQCNQCEFSATRADNLKRHIKRIHTNSASENGICNE